MNGMKVAVISEVFLLILNLIASCQSETDVCTTQLHFRKRIVCYYSGLLPPALLDPCSCTHLVLTNWKINEEQQVFNEKFENVTFVKDLKRKNANLKVLISIHANLSDSEDNHTFHFMENEPDNSFTRNLMNFFSNGSGSDLCGVELDLVMRTAEHKVTHTKLLQVLRDAFDRLESLQHRKSTSKYLLATTVSINPEDILHAYDLITISRYADMVFLPAFNFGESHDNNSLAHHSRLMGISDIENADSMVDLVISLGLDRQKIVLGIPAFGVAYTLIYSNETKVNSAATKYSDIFPYKEICQFIKSKSWTTERDEDQTNVRIYNGKLWIGYDDTLTVRIKSKFVLLRDLSGVGVWTIDDDVNDRSGCGQQMGLTNAAKNTLATMETAPQREIMESLEKDFESSTTSTEELALRRDRRSSIFRVTQIIDRSGKILVITDQMQTTLQCTRQGYYRHPQDCGQFYRCVKFNQYREIFTIFEYDCPLGLVFDERWEVCSWPSVAPPCYGSNEIFAVPKDKFVCPGQGYYRDPENCRWFYKCTDFYGDGFYTTFEFRCPYDLVFDEENLICTWRWMIPSCGGDLGQFSEGRHGYERIPSYDAAYSPTYLSNTSTIVRPSSDAPLTEYQDPRTLATLSDGRSVGGQTSQHTRLPQYVADSDGHHDIGRIGYATSSHIGLVSSTPRSYVDSIHVEKAVPVAPVVAPVRLSTPQFIIPSQETVHYERPIVHTGPGLSVHQKDSPDSQLKISGDTAKFVSQVSQMEIPRLGSKTEAHQITEMPSVYKLKENAQQSDLGAEIHLPITTESHTQTAHPAIASSGRYDPDGSKLKTIDHTSETKKISSQDKPFRYGVDDSSTTSKFPIHPGFVPTFQETSSRTSYDIHGSNSKADATGETTSTAENDTQVTASRSDSSHGYDPHYKSPSQNKTLSDKVAIQYGTHVDIVTTRSPLVQITPNTHTVLGIQPSKSVSSDRSTHVTKIEVASPSVFTSPGETHVPDHEKFETVSYGHTQGHIASEKIPLDYGIDAGTSVTAKMPVGQSIPGIHIISGHYPARPIIPGSPGVSYDPDRRKIENIDHTRPLQGQIPSEKLPTHYDLHGDTVDAGTSVTTKRPVGQSIPRHYPARPIISGSPRVSYDPDRRRIETIDHTRTSQGQIPSKKLPTHYDLQGDTVDVTVGGTVDAGTLVTTKRPVDQSIPEIHIIPGHYPARPITSGSPDVSYDPDNRKIEIINHTRPLQGQIPSEKLPTHYDLHDGTVDAEGHIAQSTPETQTGGKPYPSIGLDIQSSGHTTKVKEVSPVTLGLPNVEHPQHGLEASTTTTKKPLSHVLQETHTEHGQYPSMVISTDRSEYETKVGTVKPYKHISGLPGVTYIPDTRKTETVDQAKQSEQTYSGKPPSQYGIDAGQTTFRPVIQSQLEIYSIPGIHLSPGFHIDRSKPVTKTEPAISTIPGFPHATYNADHRKIETIDHRTSPQPHIPSGKVTSAYGFDVGIGATKKPIGEQIPIPQSVPGLHPLTGISIDKSGHASMLPSAALPVTPRMPNVMDEPATQKIESPDHKKYLQEKTEYVTLPLHYDINRGKATTKTPVGQLMPVIHTVQGLHPPRTISTDQSEYDRDIAQRRPITSGPVGQTFDPNRQIIGAINYTRPSEEQTGFDKFPSHPDIHSATLATYKPIIQPPQQMQPSHSVHPKTNLHTDSRPMQTETEEDTPFQITSELPHATYDPDHKTLKINDHTMPPQGKTTSKTVPSQYEIYLGIGTTKSPIPQSIPISQTVPILNLSTDSIDKSVHTPTKLVSILPVISGSPSDIYDPGQRKTELTEHTKPLQEQTHSEQLPSIYGIDAGATITKRPVGQRIPGRHTVQGLYPIGSIITDRSEHETTVETVISASPSPKYGPDEGKLETDEISISQEQKDSKKMPSHYGISVGTTTTTKPIIPSLTETYPISDIHWPVTATQAPSGLLHDKHSPDHKVSQEHIDSEKVQPQYGIVAGIKTTEHPTTQHTLKTQTVPGLHPFTDFNIDKSAQTTQPKALHLVIPGSTHITYDSDHDSHYMTPETQTVSGAQSFIGKITDSYIHATKTGSEFPIVPGLIGTEFGSDQEQFKLTDHKSPVQEVVSGIATQPHGMDVITVTTKIPIGQRIQGVQGQYPSQVISTDRSKYKVEVRTSIAVISGSQRATYVPDQKLETDQKSIAQKQTDSEKIPSHYGSSAGTVTTIMPIIPSQLEIHPVSDAHPSVSFHTNRPQTATRKETAEEPKHRSSQEHIVSEKIPLQPILKTQTVPQLYPLTGFTIDKSAQTTQPKIPYPGVPGSTRVAYGSDHDSQHLMPKTQTDPRPHLSIDTVVDSLGHATQTESILPLVPGSSIHVGIGSDQKQFKPTDHAKQLQEEVASGIVPPTYGTDEITVTSKKPTSQRTQGDQGLYPSRGISTERSEYKVTVKTSMPGISGSHLATYDTHERKLETIEQTSIPVKQFDSEKLPPHGIVIGTITTVRPIITPLLEVDHVAEVHPSTRFHANRLLTGAEKESSSQAPSGFPHATYGQDDRNPKPVEPIPSQEQTDFGKVHSQHGIMKYGIEHPTVEPISKTQTLPGLAQLTTFNIDQSAQTIRKPPYPFISGSTHATYESEHDSPVPMSETQIIPGPHHTIGVLTDSSGHASKTESDPGLISVGFGSEHKQLEPTNHGGTLHKDFAATKVPQTYVFDASTETKRPTDQRIQEARQGQYPLRATSTDRTDYKTKADTVVPLTSTLASTTLDLDQRILEMHDHTTSTWKQIVSEKMPSQLGINVDIETTKHAGHVTPKIQTVPGSYIDRSAHVTRTEAILPATYGPPHVTYDPDHKKIEISNLTSPSQEKTDSEKISTHYGIDAGTITIKKPIDQSLLKIQTVPHPHPSTGFSTDRFTHESRADKILPVTSAPHITYDPSHRKIQPIEHKEPSQGQIASHTLPSHYGLYTSTRTRKIIAQPTPKPHTFPALHPEPHIGIEKSPHETQPGIQLPAISGLPNAQYHPSETKIGKIDDIRQSQEHFGSKHLASGYGIDVGTGTTSRPTQFSIGQLITERPTVAGPYSIRGFGTDRSAHSPIPEAKIVGLPAQQHGGTDLFVTQEAYTLPSIITERTSLIEDAPTQGRPTVPPALKHEHVLPHKSPTSTVIQGSDARHAPIRPKEHITGRTAGERKIIPTHSTTEIAPCTTDLMGVTWRTNLDYNITTDEHNTDGESSITQSSHAIDKDLKSQQPGTDERVETQPQQSAETPFFISRSTGIAGQTNDQKATDEQSRQSGIGRHISGRGKVKFSDYSGSDRSAPPKDLSMLADKPEEASGITRKPIEQFDSLEPHVTFSQEPSVLDTGTQGRGDENLNVGQKTIDINNYRKQPTDQQRQPVTHLLPPHSTIQKAGTQQTYISTGRRTEMGGTITDGIIRPSTFKTTDDASTRRGGQTQTVSRIQTEQHEGMPTPSTIGSSIGFGEHVSDISHPSYTHTDSVTEPEELGRKTEINIPILEDISVAGRPVMSRVTLGGISFRIRPTTAPKTNQSLQNSSWHRSRPQDQDGQSHGAWSVSRNVKPAASTYGLKPFPPPPKGTHIAEKDVQVYVSKSETYAGPITCERPGLFRHPENCNQFYECYWDRWIQKFTIHFFDCPVKLVYDSDITACNWPAYGRSCVNQII